MAEELKCTKIVERDAGRDGNGKLIIYHEKCGLPAAKVTIDGILTSTQVVLCYRHTTLAQRQSYSSETGYRLQGRRKVKEDDPRQLLIGE